MLGALCRYFSGEGRKEPNWEIKKSSHYLKYFEKRVMHSDVLNRLISNNFLLATVMVLDLGSLLFLSHSLFHLLLVLYKTRRYLFLSHP